MNRNTRFSKIIGIGGIGSGVLYQLEGNHDLGRNESRMAHLLPTRDFCKQHIVLHYVARILKDIHSPTNVFPVGAVGNDSAGRSLIKQMRQSGMNVKYVSVLDAAPTLFSVCFLYPDKSGGNITESRSASSRVSPTFVASAEKEFERSKHRCLVMTAPETPLPARIKLLTLGRKHDAFAAASFASGEMNEVKRRNLLGLIDLLAINMDEAALLGGVSRDEKPQRIVEACIAHAEQVNPDLKLSITNGAAGCYTCENGDIHLLPALKVAVKSTAGAGDAFLSGLILGTLFGLPFHGDAPATCTRLARLVSAMSVCSADTINFDVTLATLTAFARKHNERKTIEALHAVNV